MTNFVFNNYFSTSPSVLVWAYVQWGIRVAFVLFVKIGPRLTFGNSCYKKLLQTGGSVFMQCTAKEAKNDIGVIGVVVF